MGGSYCCNEPSLGMIFASILICFFILLAFIALLWLIAFLSIDWDGIRKTLEMAYTIDKERHGNHVDDPIYSMLSH